MDGTTGVENAVNYFHQERLRRVQVDLLTSANSGIPQGELDQIYEEMGSGPNTKGQDLLRFLSLKPILGLPLKTQVDVEKYKEVYGAAIDNTPAIKKERLATSYPHAGRAVSLDDEGWIAANGQVATNHNVKGVGLTQSFNKKYLYSMDRPGITQDVATDIIGTNRARRAGVLTPIMLPPLIYNTHISEGKEISAKPNQFSPERFYAVQRSWSSDVRINNLYITKETYIDENVISRIRSNLGNTITLMRGRIAGFLEDAKTIDEFNARNNNNAKYFLGCSKFMNGDYSYTSYARAFQKQMIENLANMIKGNIWHDNLSAQNVSIAGEIGDWDKITFSDEPEVIIHEGWRRVDSWEVERIRMEESFEVIKEGYTIQGLMSAMLGDDSFMTVNEFLGKVQVLIPEGHWFKDVSVPEITDKYILCEHKLGDMKKIEVQLRLLREAVESQTEKK